MTLAGASGGVVITGFGLMTSVGHDAPSSLASLRAGISRFGEVSSYRPVVRDPAMHFPEALIGAPVVGVTDGLQGIERLFALSEPALREALASAALDDRDLGNSALLVAGSQRPGVGEGSRVATVLVPRLASRVSRASFLSAQYLPRGAAGFLLALQQGMALIEKERCSRCVVGCVDSWLDGETLGWLDEVRRLKSDSNVDAFIPGEAAAFVVIEPASSAARRGVPALARCGEVFAAEEKHTLWAETVCTGEALSGCLRKVIEGMERGPEVVLSDMNGESYRSTEWAYASIKAFSSDRPAPPLLHPADCIGDVGAAIGGVLVSLAVFSMKMTRAKWRDALVWCSSDDGARAAMAIQAL